MQYTFQFEVKVEDTTENDSKTVSLRYPKKGNST